MTDRDEQSMSPDDRYWMLLTRAAVVLAVGLVVMFVLLSVSKTLVALVIPLIVIGTISTALKAGHAYSHDPSGEQDLHLQQGQHRAGWKDRLLEDPSIELWRKHTGTAVALILFALLATAGVMYLRLHH